MYSCIRLICVFVVLTSKTLAQLRGFSPGIRAIPNLSTIEIQERGILDRFRPSTNVASTGSGDTRIKPGAQTIDVDNPDYSQKEQCGEFDEKIGKQVQYAFRRYHIVPTLIEQPPHSYLEVCTIFFLLKIYIF